MRYQFQMGPYFVFTFKRNLIWLRITAKMIFFLFYIVCLLLNTQPGSTKQKLLIIMATLAYYYKISTVRCTTNTNVLTTSGVRYS